VWLDAAEGELAFRRGQSIECRVNLSGRPLPLPSGAVPLLASDGDEAAPAAEASGEAHTRVLAPDTAVWLRPSGGRG
jgi:alpha-glucosidase